MSQPIHAEQLVEISGGGSSTDSRCPSSDRVAAEAALSGLMIEYQAGSLAALTELYARTKPQLTGFLLSIVDDPRTAERLAEETFVEAHRARHTYTPPHPVTPWLYAIARHLAIRHLHTIERRSR